MTKSWQFPADFTWGVATAAPQIEGAARAEGKGLSIWDHFAAQPGRTRNGGTPEIACDHYHRYPADFALMRQLGIRNYRFSIAWPRLFPLGDSAANTLGFGFYDRLIDSMLEYDLTPWCTLFHWDLPQALEDRGGWPSAEVLAGFEVYANAAVQAFGDRIKNWFTLNEIPAFIGHGYKLGRHAPGATEPPRVVNQAYHHAMVAHGLGVRAVRAHGGAGARVGLAHNPEIVVPCVENIRDIAAARTIFAQTNEHILFPMHAGHYPAAYLERCGPDAPVFTAQEMALIAQPTDFLGLNVYRGHFARAGVNGDAELLPLPAAFPRAEATWLHFVPQATYWVSRFCTELYAPPAIYISENGVGYFDAPDLPAELPAIHGWTQPAASPGGVLDLHRVQYLRSYLREVHRSIAEGLPVKGYFLWSFMDNFEWADGYAARFGIVYVDYPTQHRQPKLSAEWYRQVIRENRVL